MSPTTSPRPTPKPRRASAARATWFSSWEYVVVAPRKSRATRSGKSRAASRSMQDRGSLTSGIVEGTPASR